MANLQISEQNTGQNRNIPKLNTALLRKEGHRDNSKTLPVLRTCSKLLSSSPFWLWHLLVRVVHPAEIRCELTDGRRKWNESRKRKEVEMRIWSVTKKHKFLSFFFFFIFRKKGNNRPTKMKQINGLATITAGVTYDWYGYASERAD